MPLVDRSGGSWCLARLVLLLSLPIMTWKRMEDGWDGSCLSLAFAAIGKWRCGMEDKEGGARERSIGQTTPSLFLVGMPLHWFERWPYSVAPCGSVSSRQDLL
jgi:hypothetical protein